jgi:hypothetical protein
MQEDRYEAMRPYVFEQAAAVVEESDLQKLLDEIVGEAERDLDAAYGGYERAELDQERAEQLLVTVESWASLASHAVNEAYAGPLREVGAMRLRLAGWAKGVAARLTKLVALLSSYLRGAMHALQAVSFSIGVSFPGGVSVGLTWS